MSPAQIQLERVSSGRKIRCVLVHGHVLLRQGLRRLLEDEPDIEVVAEAESGPEALRRVFEHRPEIVITDTSSFACAAEQAERLIMRESPRSKVLFLTTHDESQAPGEKPGTGSCAVRQTSAEELVEMVRRARYAEDVGFHEMPSRKRELTVREREVLELLAEGRTVRSVAEILGLSIKTVEAHKFNLMRKLGVHNRAELVMWAIQKRMVKRPVNF